MKTYFINNNSNELILFFLGWGMDEKPLIPFKTTKDILFLYDYTNLDYEFDYSNYDKIFLIGYSAGVSIGAYLKLPKIDYAVAINGTYELCNKDFGLTNEIIQVFKSITLNNYIDFRKNYLVSNEMELEFFNKNTPLRTLESSLEELEALAKYPFKINNFKYNKVYISTKDKIFDVERQKKFWGNNTIEINRAHFPFCEFQSIDEILD